MLDYRFIVYESWNRSQAREKKMIILNTKPKKMIKSHIPKEYADNAVYFFQGTQTKNIKIGTTSGSVIARLNGISSSDILRCIGVTFGDEIQIQSQFKHLWLHGEWFKPGIELLDYITSLVPHEATGIYQSGLGPWNRRMGKTKEKYGHRRN